MRSSCPEGRSDLFSLCGGRGQRGFTTVACKPVQPACLRTAGSIQNLSVQLLWGLGEIACLRHAVMPFSVTASIVHQLILY